MRVPLAVALSSASLLGLAGVWWSISVTSVVKGILLVCWFAIVVFRHPSLRAALHDLVEEISLRRGSRLALRKSLL